MSGLGFQAALVVVLILLNAAFAGSEIALISLREGQIERLAERGARGRRLAVLARDPNRFLATIQVGITLAGFLASAAAAVTLAEPLVEPLEFLGRAAKPVAIFLVTTVLAFLTLVLGELAPKRLAMQRAERWALVAARPLSGLSTIARPAVWLLSRSTDFVVRLLGGDPDQQRQEVTEEEVRDLVAAQTSFTPEQRRIMEGALEIQTRTLREVLVPRRDVLVLDDRLTAAEGAARLIEAGHSRAPVAQGGDLDQVAGVVHLRDLAKAPAEDVTACLSETLVVPEAMTVLDALRTMQFGRQHLAVVVNEHGGTEGIVTLEDLIEELVGEIYDESDPDVLGVQREPDGVLVLPGSFPVHDLEDLGVDLPGGDYATVAGLVLDRLGRIPTSGESIVVDGWLVEASDVDERAITRVRLRPATSQHTQSP